MEHVEIRVKDVQAQLDRRVAELHREHDKFEQTTKDGFVKQNEFRGSLEDLGRTMSTRREMEMVDQTLGARMETLFEQATKERERLHERVSKAERWQAKIGGALVIISILLPTLSALLVYYVSHH